MPLLSDEGTPMVGSTNIFYVIEDNSDNATILRGLLKRVGYRYYNAWASGDMLFKWYNESDTVQNNPHLGKPDIIFLDIQIARKSGHEVIKDIRAHPQLANTVVVAVTANVLPAQVEALRTSGFDGFIGKPINPKKFPDQVQRILQGESVWDS